MFVDSKSRAHELSNDVSFVIFGHKTWDLEGGGQIAPPQHILVFKYPSRDRVKEPNHQTNQPMNQLTNEPTNQQTNQPINQLAN